MKKISVLGSTGSIGVNTLDVISRHPDRFTVSGLAAGGNVELLAQQAKLLRPKIVSIHDASKAAALKKLLKGYSIEVLAGESGTAQVAALRETDVVVSGIVGGAGLVPALAAVKAGKILALANKETLVMAGELVSKPLRQKNRIIPIDSEHSAIFQALNGEKKERVKRIILTASGGPFRTWSKERMEHITVKDALKHPNWVMGSKITIDSATMMNKGLEYIEAKWLFGMENGVEIVVHPQSIIHSMIEFVDTSIIAQLGMPDMRVPIAYALTYPDRLPLDLPSLDFSQVAQLTFEPPDMERFPCIRLAMDAMEAGQTMPAVLNAANEVAVEAFLTEQIPFKEIPEIIRAALDNHRSVPVRDVEDVLAADRWAREEAKKLVTVTHY